MSTSVDESEMDQGTALDLIRRGEDLLYIEHLAGPYMTCRSKYNRDFTDKMHFVPSWIWVKSKKYFRVHYLDLPLMEAIAFKAGYQVRYGTGVVDKLVSLRDDYKERLLWKKEEREEGELLAGAVKRAFRKYQLKASQFMYRTCRVLNADGMGAGKTAEAAGAVLLNKLKGRPYRTLVVCPASVKFAWEREFNAVCDMVTVVLDRNMDKRQEQYNGIGAAEVAIIAYDGFLADYDDLAERFNPDILIVDECHRLCNRTNRITQVLVGGRNIKKTFPMMCTPHSIYLLSGTPISNKLEDLYAILRLIDPGLFSWSGFQNRYCIMEQNWRWNHSGGKVSRKAYYKIVDYRNGKELKAKLSLHMVRRTKDEILPELPPKVFETIEVEFSPEERKIYNELRKNYRTMVGGKELTVVDQLTWMTRALQICDSLELVKGAKAAKGAKATKLKELLRICSEQAEHRKIVVFSRFKKMTDIIVGELARYMPLHIHGGVKDTDRQDIIDKFQNDEEYRVFVATLGAGGVGITLTAADLCIFYDRWWSPSMNNQAADRLHRIGQKNSVLIVNLRVKDTVEERVERVWLSKQELVTEMIGDEAVVSKMAKDELESLI